MNLQQDLLAAPGDTGGVGKSRGVIPSPTEWTMEWCVHTHTHTQTQTQQSATPGFQKETFLDVCLCDVFNLLLVNQQPSHGLTLVVQRSAVVLPGFY